MFDYDQIAPVRRGIEQFLGQLSDAEQEEIQISLDSLERALREDPLRDASPLDGYDKAKIYGRTWTAYEDSNSVPKDIVFDVEFGIRGPADDLARSKVIVTEICIRGARFAGVRFGYSAKPLRRIINSRVRAPNMVSDRAKRRSGQGKIDNA